MEIFSRLLEFVGEGSDMITQRYQAIEIFFESILGSFFPLVRTIFIILVYLAIIGVLVAHIMGIWLARKDWKPLEKTNLMYSYFSGTGLLQRKKAYEHARTLVNDHKCFFSGIGHRLGNYKHESKLVLFVITIIYIPLALLGIIEYLLRIIIGLVYLTFTAVIHALLLRVLQLFSYLLITLATIWDKFSRKNQHCSLCYKAFVLPRFQCFHCKVIHTQLVPGRSGVLFARCECGTFLPSSIPTGRSQLEAFCPSCAHNLVASNAKQFPVQLIGGDSSGKTAFLSAFHHLYTNRKHSVKGLKIYGKPTERFEELSEMFKGGITSPSSQTEVIDYNFVHRMKRSEKYNLIIYDIPDEVIMTGVYEKNPIKYKYSEGIIIIIDPLSVSGVRETLEERELQGSFSTDDTGDLIVHFIRQYSEVTGRSSRKMLNIPVAVLISKTDIGSIKLEVGLEKIKFLFSANTEKFGNNLDVARDVICREYLMKIGLTNALNNLESVFSNVRYFPISSIGHDSRQGKAFEPLGVMEPLNWIFGSANMELHRIIKK